MLTMTLKLINKPPVSNNYIHYLSTPELDGLQGPVGVRGGNIGILMIS